MIQRLCCGAPGRPLSLPVFVLFVFFSLHACTSWLSQEGWQDCLFKLLDDKCGIEYRDDLLLLVIQIIEVPSPSCRGEGGGIVGVMSLAGAA